MTTQPLLKAAVILIVLLLVSSIFIAWRAARRDQARLRAELLATQQQLADANARQKTRDSDLGRLLDQLNHNKAAVQKPAEIVKALPDVVPLPKALNLHPLVAFEGSVAPREPGGTLPDSPPPQIALPVEDLKPLYDFAVDCQACQAKLAVAQADLDDERTKTQLLTRERDGALRAARGGSVLRQLARAAKWFALGVAAGAVAAKFAH